MSSTRRRILFVDAKLQGALLMRAVGYWLFCLLAVAMMTAIWTVLFERPESSAAVWRTLLTRCLPTLAGSVLLLPLVLVDCLRQSNRFAGPMVRLRREMRALAETGQAQPLILRNHDFWEEFVADFNRLIQATNVPPETADNRAEEVAVTP